MIYPKENQSFFAEKRLAFIMPERDETIVFDNSNPGSVIKLTPYEDPNEIRIGDEIRRDDGEVIVVTGISETGNGRKSGS